MVQVYSPLELYSCKKEGKFLSKSQKSKEINSIIWRAV